MSRVDRLSALDSAFLHVEGRHAALHIGSVGVFDGPAPDFGQVREAIAGRLHRAPRYQQRMLRVTADLGRPVWHDDPDLDLDYHVRHTALPHPGGESELQDLVGRIMSHPLDHERPLWESWVVEGLEHDRWALVSKVHHCMVDGVAGTDLLTTFFGPEPVAPEPVGSIGTVAGRDEPTRTGSGLPGRGALVAQALRHGGGVAAASVAATARALARPRRVAAVAAATARGLTRFATAARPVARSSLIGDLGAARRYRWAEFPLADVLAVRSAFGCTINDVVLAAETRAFRALLVSRGEDPAPRAVRTLVPVSVRKPDQHGDLDNRVSAIVVDLPVDQPDVAGTLAEVARRMAELKRSHEAEAGELVTALADDVPPAVLAAGLRLAFRVPQRFITTVTTNVPGPRTELQLCGRPMVAAYPYVPIADQLRTGMAVTSYAGNLCFGITADWESTPDVDVLRDALVDALGDLARHAPTTKGSKNERLGGL